MTNKYVRHLKKAGCQRRSGMNCRALISATKPKPQQQKQQKVSKTMKNLGSFTHLAFLINGLIDTRPAAEPSFAEIHHAARQGALIDLLARRFAHVTDFSLLQRHCAHLEQMEAA